MVFKSVLHTKLIRDDFKKKTVNLMTSRLKVGGGQVQNIISKSIIMMTTQGGGWGSKRKVIIKNMPQSPILPTNFTNFS